MVISGFHWSIIGPQSSLVHVGFAYPACEGIWDAMYVQYFCTYYAVRIVCQPEIGALPVPCGLIGCMWNHVQWVIGQNILLSHWTGLLLERYRCVKGATEASSSIHVGVQKRRFIEILRRLPPMNRKCFVLSSIDPKLCVGVSQTHPQLRVLGPWCRRVAR